MEKDGDIEVRGFEVCRMMRERWGEVGEGGMGVEVGEGSEVRIIVVLGGVVEVLGEWGGGVGERGVGDGMVVDEEVGGCLVEGLEELLECVFGRGCLVLGVLKSRKGWLNGLLDGSLG